MKKKKKSICCLTGLTGVIIAFTGFLFGILLGESLHAAIITASFVITGSILFLGGITEFKWARFEIK